MLIDNEKHSLATLDWITVLSTFDKNEFNYYTSFIFTSEYFCSIYCGYTYGTWST